MGGAFDPSTLQPSATGRTAITLDDLLSGVPGNKPGAMPKGDPWGEYMQMMKFLTQPKTDAGPAARRAMGGMPAGPRDVRDPVELQQPKSSQSLMALLFGGMR